MDASRHQDLCSNWAAEHELQGSLVNSLNGVAVKALSDVIPGSCVLQVPARTTTSIALPYGKRVWDRIGLDEKLLAAGYLVDTF